MTKCRYVTTWDENELQCEMEKCSQNFSRQTAVYFVGQLFTIILNNNLVVCQCHKVFVRECSDKLPLWLSFSLMQLKLLG